MTDNTAVPDSPQNDANDKNCTSLSPSSSSNAARAPIPDDLKSLLLSSSETRAGASAVILAHMHDMLRALTSREFTQRLLDLIRAMTRAEVYQRFFKAFGAYIVEHPGQVAGLVIGIVLIANPLALAGFGAMGPVAGSLAAAWQASIGSVAAGSLFAALQSAGMLYAVTIPLTGGLVVAGTAAVAALNSPLVVTKLRAVSQNAREWMEGKMKKA